LDGFEDDEFDDVSDLVAGVEVGVSTVVVDWPGDITVANVDMVESVDVEGVSEVDETGNDACKGRPEQ